MIDIQGVKFRSLAELGRLLGYKATINQAFIDKYGSIENVICIRLHIQPSEIKENLLKLLESKKEKPQKIDSVEKSVLKQCVKRSIIEFVTPAIIKDIAKNNGLIIDDAKASALQDKIFNYTKNLNINELD